LLWVITDIYYNGIALIGEYFKSVYHIYQGDFEWSYKNGKIAVISWTGLSK